MPALSPAPRLQQDIQEIPIKMADGSTFGRYPKISHSLTYNMIVSDGALVDYAGYKSWIDIGAASEKGRAIYHSVNGNFIVLVIGNKAYTVSTSLSTATQIGTLQTSVGDAFISENNGHQIVITDGTYMYVYNYLTFGFKTSTLSASPGANEFQIYFTTPGYVSFQNGRILVADSSTQNWYLSGINDATQWNVNDTNNPAYTGSLQTKPDHVQAVVPIPGGGNNVLVFGHTVIEQWQDVGNALFPYQKASSFNIDYGCLNPSSIAALDNYIVWLGANEQGGATLMVSNGGREESISTDGIDFQLANITDPTNCTGFLFRQDGHLIYQFTFPSDNVSYIYDFTTKKFFNVTDENGNYHIARNVVFFQNDYFFVSLNGGNLYKFGTQFSYLDYSLQGFPGSDVKEMFRVRILPPIRLPTQRMFIVKSLGFTLENGETNTFYDASIPLLSECIDLSISIDCGQTFGNFWRMNMNLTGNRLSRMIWQGLGQCNDFTAQIRFQGFGRYVVFDGVVELYQ